MQGITIPFWIFVLLVFFAVIALLDRVLAPSVRWFFRRRLNTAIDELNSRLDTRIQPFKLTRKQTLVDQLMYDREVVQAAEEEATKTGTPISVVMEKAERYAREIVPSSSPLAYFGFGMRFAKIVSKLFYRVRVGYLNDEALSKIDPSASVVFVMNHRSNMDYLLVTYLASTRTTLSYAVGEWARIWGLQSLVRAMGAYFIRRSSNNELYRKVLARYVAMATREGVPQAFFPEGGLSTDGKLREPKFGLLSYMLSGYSQTSGRDVVFIPVGINYDRVMEDRILTQKLEQDSTGRDYSLSIKKSLSFMANLIARRLQGKLYKNGHACVSFGNPLSLNDWMRINKITLEKSTEKQKSKMIEKLGEQLITEVGNVIPVMPVALVASVFKKANAIQMTELEIKSKVFKLISDYEKKGFHVHIPREDHDYAVSTGLRMLTLRHIIREDDDGMFLANPDEKVIIDYYANSIAHL
jgi:glycerol-3-phosphate O-acyltransferase